MKVLIVDPDADSRAELAASFGATPEVQIKEAPCGTDALVMLTTFKDGFDAALIELKLPDIDGLDLIGRIRRLPKLANTAVVVFTQVRDRATVIQTLRLGVRHYVVKPAPADLVRGKVLEAVQSGTQR